MKRITCGSRGSGRGWRCPRRGRTWTRRTTRSRRGAAKRSLRGWGIRRRGPATVGTGVRMSVMLHLPGLRLTGEIEKVKRAATDMSLAVRGFYGEGSEAVGDLYQLSNQTTLGKTEAVILKELEGEIIPRVIEYER